MAVPAVADHGHRIGAPPGGQPSGVYRPRGHAHPRSYGLLERRFRHSSLVYAHPGPAPAHRPAAPL